LKMFGSYYVYKHGGAPHVSKVPCDIFIQNSCFKRDIVSSSLLLSTKFINVFVYLVNANWSC